MADCGAAGTTIDRAARAVLGSGQGQEAAKHVGALIGHASVATHSAIPLAAPEYLTMPSGITPMHNDPQMVAASNSMEVAWQASQVAAAHPANSQMMHHPPQQRIQPQQAMSHHYRQQQAIQNMMFRQQQQMMMQQQMQMMTAQQQQQKQAPRKSVEANETSLKEEVNEHLMHDDFDKWHEGLEEEANQHLQYDGILEDGIPQGATIEDLAAAWAQAEAEYEQLGDLQEDPSNLWQGEINEDVPQQYDFVNKEKPSESCDWMEEGMKHFNDGNLKEAIRSFEMELQHNNPDNAGAWRMLGRCYAENDQDPEAIKCLEAAVDRDPYSPESLLALGVSYVNELNHERALSNMKAWFTHNPKYAGLEMPPDIYGTASGASKPESAFEEVKQLLLSALAFDSTDAGGVHEALGVIYNVIRDYDAAAESFQSALKARPEDYQLWNKLGAVSYIVLINFFAFIHFIDCLSLSDSSKWQSE
jgi:peroxin-5